LRQLLRPIAPEIDMQSVNSDDNLRGELDIDSVDWLNFIVSIDEEFGIDIPEADYDKLTTLDSITQYLSTHQNTAKPG
ncbi:MAG: acyl carrier protein, partial [Bacteroidota bacterium]